MVGMVEAEVERGGKTSSARRYYLSSAQLDAATFARAVRAHWGIENRLHWVLDVVFRDDLARLRTGHGPANMAVVRHMAMNLVRQAKPDRQPQEPPQARRLEHRLPREPHPADRVTGVHAIAL